MSEYVLVPREWVEGTVGAGAGEAICRSDIELLKAVLSEQHQGEPVAWQCSDSGSILRINKAHGSYTIPLYTHADPGEVERLRGIIRMHEKTVREQAEHLAYMRAQLAERDAPVDRLRTDLDETTAVLRELVHVMYLGSPLPDWSFGESSLMTRLRAALERKA